MKKKRKKGGLITEIYLRKKMQIESDLYFLLKFHDVWTVMRDTLKV